MTDVSAIQYGSGLVGGVFESRAPEYILDIQEDSRWLNKRLAKEVGLHAYAGIPLVAGDRVVGVMSILFGERPEFTHEEKELMSLLADHAAIAIQNARLFEEAGRAAEALRRCARCWESSSPRRATRRARWGTALRRCAP
ncbi:MAG: GAF domain-containing protein [Candidatus Rokubacteria bacterium]|nr:GAF domain-containing protein [Candidatus Rokubacteria bacterium]